MILSRLVPVAFDLPSPRRWPTVEPPGRCGVFVGASTSLRIYRSNQRLFASRVDVLAA